MKNKYRYFFVIVGSSDFGVEDIDSFDTMQETLKMYKEYKMAMPTYSLKIVQRRELINE